METILSAERDLAAGTMGVARIKWKSFLAQMPSLPAFLSNFAQYAPKGEKKTIALGAAPSKDVVRSGIEGILKEVLGDDTLSDFSSPLMDMGLDSLAAVEFRNRVQSAFDGVRLASTVMFDYPTVADLTEFILSQFVEEEDEVGPGGDAGAAVRESLAMIGLSGRYPGMVGQSNDVAQFWTSLCSGTDPIQEIPIERWDIDDYYDEDRQAFGKIYVRNGGFIQGVQEFDSQFFGIADAEAKSLDAHQRLQLEVAYESFHRAAQSKETLGGVECGVFLGCCTLTGIDVAWEDIGPFTNIGSGQSGLSGRISHALGLRGPCFTIDTACSSTLVALDCAAQASRLGRQEMACVGGVNLQLRVDMWIGFCKMTGLAGDGRCKTFDSAADGFARSEGVGSLVLRLKSASEAKGELGHTVGFIPGTCVNQDGRSATITAPSGPAQQKAISAALRDAELTALEVNLVECHGTGTSLGDPIEVGAQEKTYGKNRSENDVAILAAGKSVIGHLEGAAGIAGLTKLVLMMQNHQAPANLHLKLMNPNIDLSQYNVVIPQSVVDWKAETHRAGVSSFGFSGTNSHIMAEEAKLPKEVEVTETQPLKWSRVDMSYRDWARELLTTLEWRPRALPEASDAPEKATLILGGGDYAKALQEALPGSDVFSDLSKAAKVAAALKQKEYAVLVFAEPLVADEPTLEGHTLTALLAALQAVGERKVQLLALTCGAQAAAAGGGIGRGVVGAAVWGFVRSVRMEVPTVQTRCIDLPCGFDTRHMAEAVAAEHGADPASPDTEVAYMEGERRVPRLVPAPVPAATSPAKPDSTYLITGGLGGLGLSIAQQLVDMGASSIVLCSRSGKSPAGDEKLAAMLSSIQASKTEVSAWACDVSDGAKVKAMVARAGKELAPLGSVVHAAGVLDYCDVATLTPENIASVFKPKVGGAWQLHDATKALELDSFVAFSSVSALVGLVRGVTYSASNAYLDGLAMWRRAEGLAGTSMQFGPVSEVGMASKGEQAGSDFALKFLGPKQVQAAFHRVVAKQPKCTSVLFARADWARFMEQMGTEVPVLMDFAGKEEAGPAQGAAMAQFAGLSPSELEEKVSGIVLQAANDVMGTDDLDVNDPLMESGLDSLTAVDFRNQVSKKLTGIKFPNTLMFDYPTVGLIASYAAGQIAPAAGAGAGAGAARGPATVVVAEGSGPIAVLGMACHFPGTAVSPDALWSGLMAKYDAVSEIPFERWDVDDYYDSNPGTPGKYYVRQASFIQGAESFDTALFSISPAEANTMDPQQRILLETVHEAHHRTKGLAPDVAKTTEIGTFVGECNNDWGHFKNLDTEAMNPFSGTGGSMSISANRLAYVFGFKGPSVTSDTACSSSLVALDQAVACIWRGRATFSFAAGVNLNLLPGPFVACCQARMLAEDGRCKTFDTSADGYSRGEGCGAVGVRRQDESPGLLALPAVKGTGVNQDGRSSSLTAPNGPSQQEVIMMAWQEAQIDPAQAHYIETHGTGTGLGDPIEIGALASTVGQGRTAPVVMGAVKTNISHLEGAAGIAGFLKSILVLDKCAVPANLHLKTLNPVIDLDDFKAVFPGEGPVERPAGELCNTGLSSFGFGGTNTHVATSVTGERAPQEAAAEPLVFNKQRFAWTQTKHPLSVAPRKEMGYTVYSAPIRGKLVHLLSHHIIYGEVVVPGATYIEMVTATAAFRMGKEHTKFSLVGIGFQNPFVIRPVNGEMLTQTEFCLHLHDNMKWAMHSSESGEIKQTHSEGSLDFSNPAAEKRRLDVEDVRSRCPQEVPNANMYEPFATIGLPLQPRFRTVRSIVRSVFDPALNRGDKDDEP